MASALSLADIKNVVKNAASHAALLELKRRYLGKNGEITIALRKLKNSSSTERAREGKRLHQLKLAVEEALNSRFAEYEKAESEAMLQKEAIDVTRPGVHITTGSLHPLTMLLQETAAIFRTLGFHTVLGPEVETEWYNFDALNIPETHPARDLWDTFWLKPATSHQPQNFSLKGRRPEARSKKLLLRTHTSPVQVRYLETHQPPLRIIVPGKVFRYEATDASHDIEFMQLEGLMIGSSVGVANLRYVLDAFFSRLFKTRTSVRLRPSFFPFTEPSFEVDVVCVHCAGTGRGAKQQRASACALCKGTGWLEIAGAGMVHPQVFRAAGMVAEYVGGFAFGMGLDRIAMTRYSIPDIRLFHSNDLRFLKQF
jgi:phenylalanyl-tRNA synthetase alpha chain